MRWRWPPRVELEASGADRTLTPLQRWFAYMPFEHAEDARMQEKSVTLFAALARRTTRTSPARSITRTATAA